MKVHPRPIAYSNVINRVGKAQALQAGKCFCCTQSISKVDAEHPHTFRNLSPEAEYLLTIRLECLVCQEKHTIYVGISMWRSVLCFIVYRVGPSYYGVGCSAGGGSGFRCQEKET